MTQELFLNGINADGSSPADELGAPITTEMIAKIARGQRLTPEDLRDAKIRRTRDQASGSHFGVTEGVDPLKLDESGWAIVFPADLPEKSLAAIKEALQPLLDLRKKQAGPLYREVSGAEGYRNGESKNDFLKRFGRGPGPAEPEKFPYYVLIVGSPETIPFMFQYQLDVQYAVGRIYFDSLQEYYQYARSVVEAETKGVWRGKRAAFFGVSNPDDRATQMSAENLIRPLAEGFNKKAAGKDWQVKTVSAAEATKASLGRFLGGAETPSLLFTASHGMNFKLDDPRLLPHTGSLLCQDWPGPKARVPVTDKMYFSADDVASDADVFGMFAFFFACYGGGIPKTDNFYRQAFGSVKDIAPYAFLSRLPLRLLSHPRGGALGVFAHVERAWGSSIMWDGAVRDIETFDATIEGLLNGKTAGNAIEYFNERYAEIASDLTAELDSTPPESQDEVKLAGMWTSNNDARNYTFLGDPAVRLALKEKETPAAERQNLGAIVSQSPAAVASAAEGFQPDVVQRSAAVKSASGGPGANYGLGELLSGKKEDAAAERKPNAFAEAIEKLSHTLSEALQDLTSLEVSTYVADDLDHLEVKNRQVTGAKRRAYTYITLDGDTVVCVPEVDGEVDKSVWEIHLQMVQQAQASRAALVNSIVSAASSLAKLG